MLQPRYPIYVPTKGRYAANAALTIRFLTRDQVPFFAVVFFVLSIPFAWLLGLIPGAGRYLT